MNVMSPARTSRSSWWALGLRGILAILFGIIALIEPGLALFALVTLFGAYALIDGIIAVFVSLQQRHVFRYWWTLLLEGLAGIIIGVLTFLLPIATAIVLLYLIATWAILTGIFELVAAFSRRGSAAQEWTLALAGIVSILLGVLLVLQPGAGLLTIIWLIGDYAIAFGILLLIRAFQFRSAATV